MTFRDGSVKNSRARRSANTTLPRRFVDHRGPRPTRKPIFCLHRTDHPTAADRVQRHRRVPGASHPRRRSKISVSPSLSRASSCRGLADEAWACFEQASRPPRWVTHGRSSRVSSRLARVNTAFGCPFCEKEENAVSAFRYHWTIPAHAATSTCAPPAPAAGGVFRRFLPRAGDGEPMTEALEDFARRDCPPKNTRTTAHHDRGRASRCACCRWSVL